MDLLDDDSCIQYDTVGYMTLIRSSNVVFITQLVKNFIFEPMVMSVYDDLKAWDDLEF